MKLLITALALLAAGSVQAASAPPALTPEQAQLVYSLAARPMGVVVGDKCEVRGAVWAYGARPGVRQALIDIQTMAVYGATTNAQGIYSISVPYHGKPIVLQERTADPVYAAQEVAADTRVIDGAVVCDHRLQQARSNPTTRKEAK